MIKALVELKRHRNIRILTVILLIQGKIQIMNHWKVKITFLQSDLSAMGLLGKWFGPAFSWIQK